MEELKCSMVQLRFYVNIEMTPYIKPQLVVPHFNLVRTAVTPYQTLIPHRFYYQIRCYYSDPKFLT